MAAVARTIVGIVGYYGFVRGYPLGPELMEQLRAELRSGEVEIREMNWGPVAIVQDFQAEAGPAPERIVLVGALDRGLERGTVSCRRWAGGALDPGAVQQRMFEAVTGVISLDNLLVIGAQFGIWPAQTYTVELQWPDSGLGDLVLGEIEIERESGHVIGERPLSPDNDRIVKAIVESVRALVMDASPRALPALTVDQLTPVAPVAHHRFVDDLGIPTCRR